MQNEIINIGIERAYKNNFCICTIVTNKDEYNLMKSSFEKAGFVQNTNYLIADNTNGNLFNAYEAIRRFLQESDATYTIIAHQDVRCIDSVEILNDCIRNLDKKDKNWAICGNAGGLDYKKIFYHIDNNGDIRKSPNLPKPVFSLDENLLIIKTEKQLSISDDIKTFHFYGTDLCIIADFLGYTCYVIPFLVQHLSKGNLADMNVKKPNFIEGYGKKLRSRFIQTTCTKFYFSNSKNKNNFYNNKFIFFWLKLFKRFF
jgi:hypothetical protein